MLGERSSTCAEMLVLETLRVKTRCRDVSGCTSCPRSVSGVGVWVASWPGARCEVTVPSPALYAQQGGHFGPLHHYSAK